jgi:O-succinylbenzoic acid--CoA ligase
VTYASLSPDPDAALAAALAGEVRGVSVTTSGSSGEPRTAFVGGGALRASADATHERLGGPGRWFLALPADRIAGAQVLVRSALAGHAPARMRPGRFDPGVFAQAAFAARADTSSDVPLYVSLVPTQLRRISSDPDAAPSLSVFDAILVGGAAFRREDAPSNVIETYGSTETAGGCVYDGRPLAGVDVALEADGRILVSGAVLFDGYADDAEDGTELRDGERWLQMPDAGEWAGGRLAVLGRVDDVIVTGGFKVHPAVVERALLALRPIAEAAVVAIPDDEWGERIVALVVPAPGIGALEEEALRATLSAALPRHALPRDIVTVENLPLLDSGKIDRRAARALVLPPTGGIRARDDA